MTNQTLARAGLMLAATTMLTLGLAEPAFAATGGVGGTVQGLIQNVIDILNNSVVRGLAIIAIIITGIAWMFGHVDLRRAGQVVVGIIVVFASSAIVDVLTGGGA